MSVQINQYLMYAVRLPYEWHREWEKKNGEEFYDAFEEFIDDSPFDDKITEKDGIFCLFDGANGEYIFIGKVLAKSSDQEFLGSTPLAIQPPKPRQAAIIRNSVLRNFGVEGEFKLHLITAYR